jgi:quinol monooxygenase YgiN
LEAHFKRDALVLGACVLYAATLLALAYLRNIYALSIAMLLSGVAWITAVPFFFVGVQAAVPAWVRARGLALLWVVFMGGMAGGSALWGQLATMTSMATALTVAAAGLLIAAAVTRRLSVASHQQMDLTPSSHWGMPEMVEEPEPDRGPVLVMVEYRIEPSQASAFIAAMEDVRRIRRRDGAFFWELFDDVEDPSRFVECFMSESWLEHMRHHERVTIDDRDIEEQVLPFHVGDEPPKVTHLLGRTR